MNKPTLLQKLKRYTPDEASRNLLESATDYSCLVNSESRALELRVEFNSIADKELLYRIESDIRAAYDINSARIFPHYPGELFTRDYIPQVILELQRIGAVSKGFFDNYTYDVFDADKHIIIDVQFPDGGVELLCHARTPEIVSGIIRSEFGLEYTVEIRRSAGFVENYGEYQTRQRKFDMNVIYEEEKNRPIPPPADIPPEKFEPMEPPKPKMPFVAPSDEYAEKIDDNIYRSGNTTFDVSEAELVFGEDFDIVPTPIAALNSPRKNVTVLGTVFAGESKLNRKGDKTIYNYDMTDNAASIAIKAILPVEEAEPLVNKVGPGAVIALHGNLKVDKFDGELCLSPDAVKLVKTVKRKDKAEEKRVELHIHSQLSTMDATIPPDDIIKTAHRWGHRAIAITDHGNVQGFPMIMEAAEKLETETKVIYGMEGYFVDDTARAVYGESTSTFDDEFVVFDIETTGLSSVTDKITEIGAVRVKRGNILERFQTFVDPGVHIPENITKLTGITDDMVMGAPSADEAVAKFIEFAGDSLLIAHNANFDISFIRKAAEDAHLNFTNPYLDTVAMSRHVNNDLKSHKLDNLAKYFKLGDFNHHRASDDAEMLALIFFAMVDKIHSEGIDDIETLSRNMATNSDPLKLKYYHIILLVKNQAGLKNLYKLVSRSYLDYYYRFPRIPRTLLESHRDGLIIGSACEAGELFSAVLENRPHSELCEIAKYYDYLEIQPICNNRFLLNDGRVANDEALRDLNRRIIALGEELNIPVVATCDAHFLNKEDEIYRKILLSGMKMGDADRDVGLYLRTTDEMLAEFDYLGEEKAYEVVVKNTNVIADQIEAIRPIPKGTYTPNMEGAEEDLQNMCYERAKSMYGDPLPEIVQARLDKELTSIIKNGFAVLYMIAQKLVKYSEDEGYLVGSRGSVGSSFVASMAGISEVNPLPPHSYCPNCRYSDFSNKEGVGSGFDFPDKVCPNCGTKLKNDGHDIPFETFLGFYGDKSPDIDLNFSGEVQGRVHKYTEQLFGSENVFRAGTLGTLADKTAYGFVAKYVEGKGIALNKAEMNRLVNGCVGAKRTTGQHPGGIIVVPREYDVYDFTPVQHPADDPKSDIVTTHFAFSYLHDTILKLDELGHDVPTKYKAIERFTHTSVMDVPMNDPAVYELFHSTKSLGASPEAIGSKIGTFGLPEFGTGFVQPVIVESKPKNFADLLQVSGLTHGTDVWLGNAQDLIRDGICDISQVVGTRDGIMLDLIRYGLDNSMSFKIMEFVRKNKKGKIIPEDMQNAMHEHNVPQWYIDSLQKIKYMFPKAHAAAYVMSAIRLGWYKVHMPLEFYAAFLTAAPGGFNAEIVLQGKAFVEKTIADINAMGNDASQKDAGMVPTLQLVNESMARGIKYLPVDLYKSDAKAFLPEKEGIRVPFNSLPGLGDAAAEKIAAFAADGEITSIEELRICAKISKSVIEILNKNHVLDKLSETNQLSLFSM